MAEISHPLGLGRYPVTSPFNMHRMHPILGIVRPHWGTDYGAPQGAHIHATMAGVAKTHRGAPAVEWWYGPFDQGKAVYHHTRFKGVRPGDEVGAGQRIGVVGPKDRQSTGPHLHYEHFRDGKRVDPQTIAMRREDTGEVVQPTRKPRRQTQVAQYPTRKAAAAAMSDRKDPVVQQQVPAMGLGAPMQNLTWQNAFTPQSPVPGMLMSLGAGILSARPGQNFMGPGMAAASNFMQRYPDQMMKRQYMQAQMAKMQSDQKARQAGQASLAQLAASDPKVAELMRADPSGGLAREYVKQKALHGMKMQRAREGRSVVNNYTGSNVSEFQKKLAQNNATHFGESRKAALTAEESLMRVQQMRELAKGLDTGTGTETIVAAKKLAQSMDLKLGDTSTIGQAEAFKLVVQKFLEQRFEKTKGAITEREVALFKESIPSLSTTAEGRRLMLGIMEKMAKRRIEYFKRMEEYANKHGSLKGKNVPSFHQLWRKHVTRNPIKVRKITAAPTKKPAGKVRIYDPSTGQFKEAR